MDLGIAWETLLLSVVCLSMASILPVVGLLDCIRIVDFSYSPLRIAHTTVYLHLSSAGIKAGHHHHLAQKKLL